MLYKLLFSFEKLINIIIFPWLEVVNMKTFYLTPFNPLYPTGQQRQSIEITAFGWSARDQRYAGHQTIALRLGWVSQLSVYK